MREKPPIVSELEEACAGLYYSSESDDPIEILYIHPALTENTEASIRGYFGIDPCTTIEKTSLQEFLRPMCYPADLHDPVTQQIAVRFRKLQTLLETRLEEINVYRIGDIEITVYAIGYTREGAMAGVSTLLVET